MSQRRWYHLHVATCLAAFAVGAAFMVKNVATTEVYTETVVDRWHITGGYYPDYIAVHVYDVEDRGWPFTFRRSLAEGNHFNPSLSSHAATTGVIPGRSTLALAFNVAVGCLMVLCTAIACEYRRHHVKGAFQFGLRSLLLLVAATVVFLVLLDHDEVTWWDLLYVPLGLGLLSMPFVVGLFILRRAGRSDARLTLLRNNALPTAEAEKASDFLRTLSATD